MFSRHAAGVGPTGDPDWDFFLPDDEEALPEPGDFWFEPDEDE